MWRRLWAVEGNVVPLTAQMGELRDWRKQRENVHLSALSLTMITPFELPAFMGSQWFHLICATLSGRQLGFGEKAKFCSCPCNLCLSRSPNPDCSDVGSTAQNKVEVTNTLEYFIFFSLLCFSVPSPNLNV